MTENSLLLGESDGGLSLETDLLRDLDFDRDILDLLIDLDLDCDIIGLLIDLDLDLDLISIAFLDPATEPLLDTDRDLTVEPFLDLCLDL